MAYFPGELVPGVLEKLFLGKLLSWFPKAVGIIYTLMVVLIGWVLFALETLSGAGGYLQAMAGLNGNVLDREALYLGRQYVVLFLISLAASTPLPHTLERVLERSRTGMGIALYRFGEKLIPAALLVMSIAGIVEASYNPFLYFRF